MPEHDYDGLGARPRVYALTHQEVVEVFDVITCMLSTYRYNLLVLFYFVGSHYILSYYVTNTLKGEKG